MLAYDWDKAKVINTVEDEKDRIKLVSYLEEEQYKVLVIQTVTDVTLKISALSLLTKDSNKARIIVTIQDENTRFQLLEQIKDESAKGIIMSSFTNSNLLYKALLQLKDENVIANILVKANDDNLKYQLLSSVGNQSLKANVIHSMTDSNLKMKALATLTQDYAKLKVINHIENESLQIKLLSLLEKHESQFIVLSEIKSNEIKINGLKSIENYQAVMNVLFQKGLYSLLYHFEPNILKQVFDEKQIYILNEYSKIKNENIRDAYSDFVSKNYEFVRIENVEQIAQLLFRIETSNSSELRRVGDLVARELLKKENPLQYFNKIEDIFVKNNIPYVGKIFEVFKLLHSDAWQYRNYSPLLNRLKNNKYQTQTIDLILFNDLLKCAFGSNNRSLKEFLANIENGNHILTNVMSDKTSLMQLDDNSKAVLSEYLDKIELLIEEYEEWKDRKKVSKTSIELLERINKIMDKLHLKENEYHEIPSSIIKKICGISGIENLENAKRYLEIVLSETDKRNREKSKERLILEEGDFVKGINDIKYFPMILQNGSVSKEFLGDSATNDNTPLDTDVSRISAKNLVGKSPTELGKIIGSTISSGYGTTWLVLKNDPNRIQQILIKRAKINYPILQS